MSSFQKLLNRFLGQIEGSYEPNLSAKTSSHLNLSTLHRSRSLSKVIKTRRQHSFDAFKSASCLSCGVDERDQQLSTDNNDTLTAISLKREHRFETKSLVGHNNEYSYLRQQQLQMRQKRRAKAKLVIIRHGERVDALFGDNWIQQAFDRAGNYRRFHTNLPASLPYRQNYQDYRYDPPLTELGLIRSFRTGFFVQFLSFLCMIIDSFVI